MTGRTIEIGRDDLGGFLEGLAERLRADALALGGYAALHAPLGSGEGDRGLEGLTTSLERTAKILESVGAGLCRDCRLLDVTEQLTLVGKEAAPTRGKGRKSSR